MQLSKEKQLTNRWVQQAIHQVLSVKYEKIFFTNSYGFRSNKNTHAALKQAGLYVAQGKNYVIDLDEEKFFDEVNRTLKYIQCCERAAKIKYLCPTLFYLY